MAIVEENAAEALKACRERRGSRSGAANGQEDGGALGGAATDVVVGLAALEVDVGGVDVEKPGFDIGNMVGKSTGDESDGGEVDFGQRIRMSGVLIEEGVLEGDFTVVDEHGRHTSVVVDDTEFFEENLGAGQEQSGSSAGLVVINGTVGDITVLAGDQLQATAGLEGGELILSDLDIEKGNLGGVANIERRPQFGHVGGGGSTAVEIADLHVGEGDTLCLRQKHGPLHEIDKLQLIEYHVGGGLDGEEAVLLGHLRAVEQRAPGCALDDDVVGVSQQKRGLGLEHQRRRRRGAVDDDCRRDWPLGDRGFKLFNGVHCDRCLTHHSIEKNE